MDKELKPCPFCAGEDVVYESINEPDDTTEDWGVRCNKCGAFFMTSSNSSDTKEDVAKFWNMRLLTKKILPQPCTDIKPKTLREWFARVDDKLNSFKEDLIVANTLGLDTKMDSFIDTGGVLAENSGIALITEITSMLEAMGIDEEMRQEAQMRLNNKNYDCGRF